MKKWLLGMGLAFMLVLSVLGLAGTSQATEHEGHTVPPVTLPPVTHTITLPPQAPITIPGPRITVPGPPVTLPRPTVTLPRVTVTRVIRVPVPVTTTDIVRVPGPTRTVRVTGPTRTVTATETGQTRTTTATVTATQTVTPPPVTKTVTKIVKRDGVVTVERAKAVGISLGLLLLGAALALLSLYITYAVGYKDAELAEERWAERVLNDLFRKR